MQSPCQGRWIGLGRRQQVFALEPRYNEPVDRAAWPGAVADAGHHRARGRDVGPVRLILPALGNPVTQQLLFVSAELLAGVRRRHQVVLVVSCDAGEQFAPARGTGRHRRVAVEISQCAFAGVQSEIGLAVAGIRPVAGKAFVSKNRADIAIELNLTGVRHACGQGDDQ